MKTGIIFIYLIAIVIANMIAFYVGQWGIVITAALLLPLDFVLRSYFHERWRGRKLIFNMGSLILAASGLSYIINHRVLNIAIASFTAFLIASVMASLFYQAFIRNGYIVKVNGSDFIAIIFDSMIFQKIAFDNINFLVMISQITLKVIGGLFWYWILFERIKIHHKW